jgi:hypothetical protein
VEEVIIFGDGRHHSALKQLVEQELALPVRLIDPFDRVQWESPQRTLQPDFPGTFAPLLGILMDEASQTPHAIDFLHPRKKPPPRNRRRTAYLAAGAIGAIAMAICLLLLMQIWALDAQIARLRTQKSAQEKIVKQGTTPREQLAALDRFAAADVNWLEELRRLSEKFPPPEATLVEEFNATYVAKDGGGKISLTGLADEPATIASIEQRLRDAEHVVRGTGGKYDSQLTGSLKWRFKEDISIAPVDPTAPLPEVKQPDSSVGATLGQDARSDAVAADQGAGRKQLPGASSPTPGGRP